jgi:bifunctional lysine-specific demethylase and histidyl-hydroxylase MINA
MLFQDAEALLGRFFAPLTVGQFLDEVVTGPWRHLKAADADLRLGLLGPDPAAVLAGAAHLAPTLTYHSARPLGPAPSLEGILDAADFRGRIDTFHDRGWSVRFPTLRPLAAPLDQLARALEALLLKPVTASAFWSRGDLLAPVHSDDHDILVVQLLGRKRWYLSDEPSALENTWERIPGPPPTLGSHRTLELVPGDVLYVPRGTVHTVDASDVSLHVAIGFTPVTLRELLIAAIDQLSDHDRGWRTTVGQGMGYHVRGAPVDGLATLARQAVESLNHALTQPGFMASALQRRAARTMPLMGPLVARPAPNLSLDTTLRQRREAWCHLSADATTIDVAYPGGHLYIHRGAEAAVLHIVQSPSFRIRDLPGGVDDEVKLSLATRFCEIGYLETA